MMTDASKRDVSDFKNYKIRSRHTEQSFILLKMFSVAFKTKTIIY